MSNTFMHTFIQEICENVIVFLIWFVLLKMVKISGILRKKVKVWCKNIGF